MFQWPRVSHQGMIRSAEWASAWRLIIDTGDAELASWARAGRPMWQWRNTADKTRLEIWGTPPRDPTHSATATRFEVDYVERTITIGQNSTDTQWCLDLLTRWLLPDIGRRERRVLVLHACAVEIAGRVLVISGDSGRGKSTLCAALLAEGARLVGDEPICLGVGQVWPGSCVLRLAPDVESALLGSQSPVDGVGKVQVHKPVSGGVVHAPPCLVFLQPRRASGSALEWEWLARPEGLVALMEARYSGANVHERLAEDFERAAEVAVATPALRVSLLDDLQYVREAARELVDLATQIE